MKKETRNAIIIVAVLAILLGGGYLGLKAYSGVEPPMTVINSGSMMHSKDSQIGIIDTGDMIVVRSPDKVSIKTYVDGEKSGYRSFGEYGDVIVYKKPNQNIIHRAMVHLELRSNDGSTVVWYIPSLQGYDKWDVTSTNDYSTTKIKDQCWNEDTGELTLTSAHEKWYFWLSDVGYGGVNAGIDLYAMGKPAAVGYSGYLTKGDNAATNRNFDQSSSIYPYLVDDDIIKSVAEKEVPWLGSIKLMLKGNGDSIPSNSKTNLLLSFLGLVAVIVAANIASGYISKRLSEKKKE